MKGPLAALIEKDGSAAAEACDRAIGLEPDHAMAAELWYMRAVACALQSQQADARRSLERGDGHRARADGPPTVRDALRKQAEEALKSGEASK